VQGSVIVSEGQTGGQVAHIINNFAPRERVVSSAAREAIVSILRREPGRVGVASTQGDMEAHQFKLALMDVFREAGWTVTDMQTFMFFGERKGLVVTIPFGGTESGRPELLRQALDLTGNPVSGNHGDMANDCEIYVQVWHAP
jgi:hypothetical protein